MNEAVCSVRGGRRVAFSSHSSPSKPNQKRWNKLTLLRRTFVLFLIGVFIFFTIWNSPENDDFSKPQKPIFCDLKNPVSIYVVSHKQATVNPDLRGQFWEYQINFKSHPMITIDYLSSRQFVVNGVTFKGEDKFQTVDTDRKLCLKAKLVFESFLSDHSKSAWLMRATHDSYINIENLISVVNELETKYDPYTQRALAYGLFSNKNLTFPHGSIILFSRKFVIDIMNDISNFNNLCQTTADDIAFGIWMQRNNIELEEFRNEHFHVNWPSDFSSYQSLYFHKLFYIFGERCPSSWTMHGFNPRKAKQVSKLAAIHFHNLDMRECQRITLLFLKNEKLGVYHDESGASRFCYFK